MDDPVLLTGARGHVGTALLDYAGEEYDWRLLDRDPPADESAYPGEFFVADITDEDAVRDAMAGCGAVVHLAGDPRKTAPWSSVLSNNIDGTHTVLQAAVDEGVEKFAFASSNHAVKHFETDRRPDLYRQHDDFLLDGHELPRPGNLYGVSKATGETLGRFYHDEHDLSFVAVRIGNLTEEHPPKDYERGQAMWLSYRDCGHLFARTIEADYDYEIVYGISDNDRKYYSLEKAKRVLGYEPKDNSAEYDGE